MDDKLQRELFRKKLEETLNKVPDHIRNGSIQATRAWMKHRDAAAKLLKKPNATVTQLMGAIQSLQ